MAVTPSMIAVALGVAAPELGSAQDQQWAMWIDDAEMLIDTRHAEAGADIVVDEVKRDYVVREAVVAHIKHPDDSTQVSISVDDASSMRSYKSGSGRVSIRDEWWALLGLAAKSSGAFSFRPSGVSSIHAPWCNLNFGATYCSCGADIAGHPIFEQPL